MKMFKDSFKHFKSRDPPPELDTVIDFRKPDFSKVRCFLVSDVEVVDDVFTCESLGLTPTANWNVYEITDKPGLIFIENPFTAQGQRCWISRCVKDYSRKPSKTNLDSLNVLSEKENWWEICCNNVERAKVLLSKLRWATMGYHHNWDTKEYSEKSKCEMPRELVELTGYFAKIIDLPNFKAEATIVNYYGMNSTLSGHTDHSEVDCEAPLFSVSFGQTAIFLIGGLTREEPADAIFLRSGDVVVMSKQSRLRYHGVPKILKADSTPWEHDDPLDSKNFAREQPDWEKLKSYVQQSRINMNVRQVLKPEQSSLDN